MRTQLSTDELDELRRKANSIIERLKADEAFRAKVQADPDAALNEEGMTMETFEDFTRGMGVSEEVFRLACPATCIKGTTACTHSCLV